MEILKNRFPSKNDILLVFTICVLPNHIWSIVNTLRDVPAWIIKMSLWEVIGVISYIQTMVLIESIVFFIGLVSLAIMLPARFFREKFLVRSSILMLFAVVTALIVHLTTGIRNTSLYFLIFLTIMILIFFIWHNFLKISHNQLKTWLALIYDRFMVLSFFYILIDLFCIFVVIFRNL